MREYSTALQVQVPDTGNLTDDVVLRQLQALVQAESGLASITGTAEGPGRVGISATDIGTGMYAHAAALALKKYAPQLSAEEMVREALNIAADICVFTNHNLRALGCEVHARYDTFHFSFHMNF